MTEGEPQKHTELEILAADDWSRLMPEEREIAKGRFERVAEIERDLRADLVSDRPLPDHAFRRR